MENSFRTLLDSARSILIVIPSKPYFDQVAGALSLYLSLREHKEVSIMSPTPMTVEFNRLIGVNKITQDLGNKNLMIKFSGYEASNIERVSYDIENRQFQLTVIPKPGVNAPNKDQVELSYTGFSNDVVILIGGANESHFPLLAAKDAQKAKIMHIGIRDIASSSSSKIISFDRPASCDSELVAALLIEANYALDSDSATNLLMGIEEGSSNYTSPGVSAQTFEVVSTLMRAGGTRLHQNTPTITQSDFPPGALPSQMMPQMQPPMPRPQPVTQQPLPVQNNGMNPQDALLNPNEEPPLPEEIPDEWLQKPKVHTGTSMS